MLNQPDSVSSRARQIKNLLRSTFELAILAEFFVFASRDLIHRPDNFEIQEATVHRFGTIKSLRHY